MGVFLKMTSRLVLPQPAHSREVLEVALYERMSIVVNSRQPLITYVYITYAVIT